jgi:hypothetical protein
MLVVGVLGGWFFLGNRFSTAKELAEAAVTAAAVGIHVFSEEEEKALWADGSSWRMRRNQRQQNVSNVIALCHDLSKIMHANTLKPAHSHLHPIAVSTSCVYSNVSLCFWSAQR